MTISRTALAPCASARSRSAVEVRTAELLDRYVRDPFAHMDDGHVKTLDLVTLEEIPFLPYDHQRELGGAWVDLPHLTRTGRARWRNGHNEKSRQMGDTWILAWLILWSLSYHSGMGLAMSLKYEEIDDGGSGSTLDSLFGKVRFMWERLPDRYRPPLSFKYGQIKHEFDPLRFVEATGAIPDSGRGGRYHWVVIDEAARIPFAEAVHKSIARAAPVGRFYNSTPEGEGNLFYRLRRERPRGWRFLRHHWTRHPVYGAGQHVAGELDDCALCRGNRESLVWRADRPIAHRYPGRPTSPWYDEAILELTDEQVASELDIDYAGSLTGRVFKEFTEEQHVSPHTLLAEPTVGVELAIDYGADTTSVVFVQDLPEEVRVIGEIEYRDTAYPDAVAPEILRVLRELGVEERLLTPEWTLRMRCIGDPAGEQRQQATGRTLVAHYRSLGFNILSRPMRVNATVIATKRLLLGRPKPLIVSGPACPLFVEHMLNHRWEQSRDGQQKPVLKNDQHGHMTSAFRYWCCFKFPPGDDDARARINEATAAIQSVDVDRIRSMEPNGGARYDMKL